MNISSNTKRGKWTLGCQADLMLDKLFAGNHPSIENPDKLYRQTPAFQKYSISVFKKHFSAAKKASSMADIGLHYFCFT